MGRFLFPIERIKCFTMRWLVKSAPAINRIDGPKLVADIAPTKYRPGIEDSKCADKRGVSPINCSFSMIPALKYPRRRTSAS